MKMKKGRYFDLLGIGLILIGIIWSIITAIEMWDVAMSMHLKWQAYWKPVSLVILGQVCRIFRE